MGMEKAAHQTATVRKDILDAHAASGMPNIPGPIIIRRLHASRIPPPRYPQA